MAIEVGVLTPCSNKFCFKHFKNTTRLSLENTFRILQYQLSVQGC